MDEQKAADAIRIVLHAADQVDRHHCTSRQLLEDMSAYDQAEHFISQSQPW